MWEEMLMGVSWKRITAITRKNLQMLLHDRRTLGLLIFMPILMMLLFGFAFGQSVTHVPIKIVNFDNKGGSTDTHFSDLFINTLKVDDRVDIKILDPVTFSLSEEIIMLLLSFLLISPSIC